MWVWPFFGISFVIKNPLFGFLYRQERHRHLIRLSLQLFLYIYENYFVCVFAFPLSEQHMIDNLDREKARVYNTRRE